MMSRKILIVGDGLLANYVNQQLSVHYPIIHQNTLEEPLPENIHLALVLHDGSLPLSIMKLKKYFAPLTFHGFGALLHLVRVSLVLMFSQIQQDVPFVLMQDVL